MKYLLKMLSQPSTYAGFAGLAASVGIAAPLYAHVAAAAAALFGLVAFVIDGDKAA